MWKLSFNPKKRGIDLPYFEKRQEHPFFPCTPGKGLSVGRTPEPRTHAWSRGKPTEKRGKNSNIFPYLNSPDAGNRACKAEISQSRAGPALLSSSMFPDGDTCSWSKLLVWSYGSFQKQPKSFQRGVLTPQLTTSKVIKMTFLSSLLVSHGLFPRGTALHSPEQVQKGWRTRTWLHLTPNTHQPLPYLVGGHSLLLLQACSTWKGPCPLPNAMTTGTAHPGRPHRCWKGGRLLRAGRCSWSFQKKGRLPPPSPKQPPRWSPRNPAPSAPRGAAEQVPPS